MQLRFGENPESIVFFPIDYAVTAQPVKTFGEVVLNHKDRLGDSYFKGAVDKGR